MTQLQINAASIGGEVMAVHSNRRRETMTDTQILRWNEMPESLRQYVVLVCKVRSADWRKNEDGSYVIFTAYNRQAVITPEQYGAIFEAFKAMQGRMVKIGAKIKPTGAKKIPVESLNGAELPEALRLFVLAVYGEKYKGWSKDERGGNWVIVFGVYGDRKIRVMAEQYSDILLAFTEMYQKMRDVVATTVEQVAEQT